MNQYEKMQKLAFGKIIKQSSINEEELRKTVNKIVLSEAKKKKSKKTEDTIEPEPIDDTELDVTSDEVTDTVEPEPESGVDIDPKVKSIQNSLQKAYANAKQLGDKKLVAQIGNTITMLTRTQILGGQQGVMENLLNENKELSDYNGKIIQSIQLEEEFSEIEKIIINFEDGTKAEIRAVGSEPHSGAYLYID